MAALATLDAYMGGGLYRVHGFLKALDAVVIAKLAAFQAAQGWGGSLAEIGVHHGKLFFILALSRRPGEGALAMDLFEDDAGNTGTVGQERARAFFDHARRLGVALSEAEVLKGDSTRLAPDDILGRVGRVRLFSVDGGHRLHHVESDLKLAESVLTDEGVIVIDDFCSALWPEVTFAACDFLRANPDRIAPALLTRNKLYVCRPDRAAAYAAFARTEPALAHAPKEAVAMLGREAPYLRQTVRSLIVDELRSRAATRFTAGG